jgi:uncharacterized protein
MKKLDDYQRLAALIAATKGIDSQRLQKLVFVLETLQAPFQYRYRMHFDEPYSEDLEADVNLLTSLGLANQDHDPLRGVTTVCPNGQAKDYLKTADELTPYLRVISDLTAADTRVLDFVASFGAWREFKYEPGAALERAASGTKDRKVDEEGERFLQRLGLLTAT